MCAYLRGVFTTRRYTNPRLHLPYLYQCQTVVNCSSLNYRICRGVVQLRQRFRSVEAEHFFSILIQLRHCLQSAEQYRSRDVEPVSQVRQKVPVTQNGHDAAHVAIIRRRTVNKVCQSMDLYNTVVSTMFAW